MKSLPYVMLWHKSVQYCTAQGTRASSGMKKLASWQLFPDHFLIHIITDTATDVQRQQTGMMGWWRGVVNGQASVYTHSSAL